MSLKSTIGASLGALLAVTLFPVVAAGDLKSSLQGAWATTDEAERHRLRFYPNEVIAIEKKKPNLPSYSRVEGAYRASESGACTLSKGDKVTQTGNLWVVHDSTRCCYKVYFMGDTLVMDKIEDGRYHPRMDCEGKTLKRLKEK